MRFSSETGPQAAQRTTRHETARTLEAALGLMGESVSLNSDEIGGCQCGGVRYAVPKVPLVIYVLSSALHFSIRPGVVYANHAS